MCLNTYNINKIRRDKACLVSTIMIIYVIMYWTLIPGLKDSQDGLSELGFVETRLITPLPRNPLIYNQLQNFPLEGELKGVLSSEPGFTGLKDKSGWIVWIRIRRIKGLIASLPCNPLDYNQLQNFPLEGE